VRVVGCALGCVVAVTLAGCGGSSTTKTVTVTAAAKAARVTGTTPSRSTTTVAATSPPLATRAGSVDGSPVTLSILSLNRSGLMVELTISLTTTVDKADVGGWFDDGIDEAVKGEGPGNLDGSNSLDGIFLVDTTDAKKYSVARDANNKCLCDDNLFLEGVTNAAPLELSAMFGAPPASVTAVNVFIPHYGTFVNVPLS
jgi:hypothetical protein